jgi:nucleotide-binding universal stress UspA family protein
VRIVIAVDPSHPSGSIASALSSFPLPEPLDIVVVSALSVRPPPLTSPGPVARRLYGGAMAALHAEAWHAAARAAERVRENLAPRAVRVAVRISDRAPALAIVEAAVWWSADLVLTGPSGASRVRRALLGSVPDDVVRTAACPVLVAKRSSARWQRVLAATDGSLHAEAALRFLASLPLPGSSEVRVCSVAEPPATGWIARLSGHSWGQDVPPLLGELQARTMRRSIAAAQEILAALPCPILPSLRAGNVHCELADEVARWVPDLLVLGARGRTAGPETALGSLTEAVLRGTTCSALVVRA